MRTTIALPIPCALQKIPCGIGKNSLLAAREFAAKPAVSAALRRPLREIREKSPAGREFSPGNIIGRTLPWEE